MDAQRVKVKVKMIRSLAKSCPPITASLIRLHADEILELMEGTANDSRKTEVTMQALAKEGGR